MIELTYFCPAMDKKEEKIIVGARDLFMKYGIKSLNMDDIARQLSISKKTLYQIVSDKNDLVDRAFAHVIEDECCRVKDVADKGLNAIDELFEVSKVIVQMLSQIHPSIHFDMVKFHPEVFKNRQSQQQEMVYDIMHQNLEKGKKEGLYREDLKSHIIAKIYIARMDMFFDGETFPPHETNFQEVYMESFRYHIRGIASDKGVEYLVKKVKNQQESQ